MSKLYKSTGWIIFESVVIIPVMIFIVVLFLIISEDLVFDNVYTKANLGNPGSQIRLAMKYRDDGDIGQAHRWLETAISNNKDLEFYRAEF